MLKFSSSVILISINNRPLTVICLNCFVCPCIPAIDFKYHFSILKFCSYGKCTAYYVDLQKLHFHDEHAVVILKNFNIAGDTKRISEEIKIHCSMMQFLLKYTEKTLDFFKNSEDFIVKIIAFSTKKRHFSCVSTLHTGSAQFTTN